MSKKKLTAIYYIILIILCILAGAYRIWKEKLDIEFKQKAINMSEVIVQND